MKFETHHVCLKVASIDRAKRFYEQALGFRENAVCHHTPTVRSCFMMTSDGLMQIQLLQLPDYIPRDTAYGHLGMKTEDIQKSFEFHTQMGCVSAQIVEQAHQFGYFIKDPDGYETELVQLK
ncbi:VOC family protein [Oscillibacter sp. GMB15532]|uniref:VOC family protein n=1 Tax=Oscillibacter sp. GMB15532 TaxID=3230022 RepID=UPI0034DEB8B0